MVTAGANQAFTNVVLTLLDSQDKVVLFKPYYFNHLMAVQMTGGADNVVYGRYSKLPLQHSHLPIHAFVVSFTSMLIHALGMHVTSMQNPFPTRASATFSACFTMSPSLEPNEPNYL